MTLPIGVAPWPYATVDDVYALSPLRVSDLNAVITRLPAGALDRLILSHSRTCDTYLSKRTSVPLKQTPHASITRYVALQVSCDLQAKLGEIPDADQTEFRNLIREGLREWIRAVVDPTGFVEIPDSDTEPGVSYTKARTKCIVSPTCYPAGYGPTRIPPRY